MSASLTHHRSVVAALRAAGCVFAEDEARLLISAARTPADLAAMVDRRAAGLPLEHVLGWTDFCGVRIAVDPGVFVPRRRTLPQVAALAAAVLIASQLGIDHWFYLYLPWFAGLVFVATAQRAPRAG